MDVGIDQAGKESLPLAGNDLRVRRYGDLLSHGGDLAAFDDHGRPGQDLFPIKNTHILDDDRLSDFRGRLKKISGC